MTEMRSEKNKGRTPLMRQYYAIKAQHPQALLLFRMGDFFETFDEDAKQLSKTLGIALTKRSNGKAYDVPLAGFPHHALNTYLPKLVEAGFRVAVCEQTEDPGQAKTIVKRDVVEVVTPGVYFDDNLLDPKQSNYLAAVWPDSGRVGVAFLDASTGEFFASEGDIEELPGLVQTIQPVEVLVDRGHRDDLPRGSFVVTPVEDWVFGYDFARQTLLNHFGTHSLKGFGVDALRLGTIAAGAVMHYLGETQKGRLLHVRKIVPYDSASHMTLDPQTKRNMELVAPLHGQGREDTLVSILDRTQTPMGGRQLRRWLVRPLREVAAIERRLDAVEDFFRSRTLRTQMGEELEQMGDLERLAVRIATGRATPRDMVAVKLTLRQLPAIKQLLSFREDCTCDELREAGAQLTVHTDLIDLIDRAIVDDPPAGIGGGGLIRDGYNEELDTLRRIARSGKDWLVEMQKKEIERTGISSLKVGFNKVFGYYLEVTNTHKDKVPDDYIRKQTLVSAERYIVPELKEYEEKILTAEERIDTIEANLFAELRAAVAEYTEALQRNAALLGMVDCYMALADAAVRFGYVRPEVHDGRTLEIEGGRHPVVEQALPAGEPFIPNSIYLDPDGAQIILITGPNMAGKSVVLRQTGLIVLLAQVGSFVPAESARIGIVDRIFTRVGASDNLAEGESTFLVEMNETANILNNATPRSLILLDEVGRGTSTFDGLSIAWALVEYLHEREDVAARTLFATHYHELNELANRYDRVRTACIRVEEHAGRVIFLRKLAPEGADHSFGIEVARMAGLPEPVIARARQILQRLESRHTSVDTMQEGDIHAFKPSPKDMPMASAEQFQMSLFDRKTDPVGEALKECLGALDTDRMTPLEALQQLDALRRLLD